MGKIFRSAVTLTAIILAVGIDGAQARTAKDTAWALPRLREALAAYQQDDCKTVLKQALPVVDAKPPIEEERLLAAAYDLVIGCEAAIGRSREANDHAVRATALWSGSDFAWRMRLLLALADKRHADAVATIEAMLTEGRAAALNAFDPPQLWRLHRDLDEAGRDDLDLRLLKVLTDTAYQPEEPNFLIEGKGSMGVAYARKLLTAGQRDRARAALGEATGLSAMLAIMFDRDLRALLDRKPDLRAVVEADLERHRALMQTQPDRLGVVNDVALDLRRLGRLPEALAVLDAARARTEREDGFVDRGRYLPWWWDQIGYVHAATGDYDAMVASFSRGAALHEEGAPNVSQVINLAALQLRFGKADAALATLLPLGDGQKNVSPYGRMQILGVRGRAYAQKGDTARAAAMLADAIEHETDDPSIVTDLLLALNDQDGAAASYIRRLDNPKWRTAALIELSDYDAPDPRAPAHPFLAGIRTQRSRADVQAAIERAGGIETLGLQRDTLY